MPTFILPCGSVIETDHPTTVSRLRHTAGVTEQTPVKAPPEEVDPPMEAPPEEPKPTTSKPRRNTGA